MRYGYVIRDRNGVRRSKPQINFTPSALGDGNPQAVSGSGGNLTYVFNNMFWDNDNFSTAFNVKREGVYRAEAHVILEWAVVPTTGTVLVQIKDAGSTVVCGWLMPVTKAEVQFTLGGLHTIERDSFFEVYIQNDSDQNFDATVKMGVHGIIWAQ